AGPSRAERRPGRPEAPDCRTPRPTLASRATQRSTIAAPSTARSRDTTHADQARSPRRLRERHRRGQAQHPRHLRPHQRVRAARRPPADAVHHPHRGEPRREGPRPLDRGPPARPGRPDRIRAERRDGAARRRRRPDDRRQPDHHHQQSVTETDRRVQLRRLHQQRPEDGGPAHRHTDPQAVRGSAAKHGLSPAPVASRRHPHLYFLQSPERTSIAPAEAPMRSALAQGTAGPSASQAVEAVRERAADLGELISAADILFALAILGATYYLIRAITSRADALPHRMPRPRLPLPQPVPPVRIPPPLGATYLVVAGIIEPSRESLIAFAATAGIGIGFAAQDVLKNVFGGILIVMDRPFQVGDLVDLGHYHGEVVGIGLRATRIRTSDDSIVTVPNAEVVNQAALMARAGALDLTVTIELFLPAHVDMSRAREICYEAAATSPYLYIRKPITVR